MRPSAAAALLKYIGGEKYVDQQSCNFGSEPSVCRQTSGTRRVNAAGTVQPPDALELSGEAQSFGDILQKLRGMDDVRAERVEALSARTHEPASADIAAKMLAMRY